MAFYEKHRKGMPLTSDEKRIVLNVFYKLSEKYPEVAINDITEMTSEFTGVSVSAIFKARKELKVTGNLTTKGKTRRRKSLFVTIVATL